MRLIDTALMLSAIAGFDSRDPISITENPDTFRAPLDRDFTGVRIAWSQDLGQLPVDPEVTNVLESRRDVFHDLGCIVEEAEPEFEKADEIFKVWRAWLMELKFGELIRHQRDLIKDTVIWNVEQGMSLTGPQIGQVERMRTDLYHGIGQFMKAYDFLLLPVSQVPPFPVTTPYVTEINGTPMKTYIDWMKSCYYITVTGLPAISVPAGFTDQGLPVGIQIVGRHQRELEVLQLAHAFEQATQYGRTRPALAVKSTA